MNTLCRSYLRYLCLSLVYLSMAVLAARAQAQSSTVVRCAPATTEVAVADAADVAVEVVGVDTLYGFDITLTFDPEAVEVVDADPALDGVQVALGHFLDPGFVLLNSAENASGRLRFAMTQLNPASPKSGTGTLIVVKLRGKRAGASSVLHLEDAQLAGPGGVHIDATPIGGQISVLATSRAGPTSTPIPIQGPGTPLPTAMPSPTPTQRLATEMTSAPAASPTPTGTPARTPMGVAPLPESPVLVNTPGDATPQQPAATPTVHPSNTAATPPSPEVSDTPAAAGVTALQPTPSGPPPTVPPAQPSATAAPLVQVVEQDRPSVTDRTEPGPDPARLYLLVAIGALGLALVLGLAALVVWLTRWGAQSPR